MNQEQPGQADADAIAQRLEQPERENERLRRQLEPLVGSRRVMRPIRISQRDLTSCAPSS
jgi:hypothetical protein